MIQVSIIVSVLIHFGDLPDYANNPRTEMQMQSYLRYQSKSYTKCSIYVDKNYDKNMKMVNLKRLNQPTFLKPNSRTFAAHC